MRQSSTIFNTSRILVTLAHQTKLYMTTPSYSRLAKEGRLKFNTQCNITHTHKPTQPKPRLTICIGISGERPSEGNPEALGHHGAAPQPQHRSCLSCQRPERHCKQAGCVSKHSRTQKRARQRRGEGCGQEVEEVPIL